MKTAGKAKAAATRNVEQTQSVDSGARTAVRLVALGTLTAALIALSILLAFPFLPAITWAVALAIIAWPMHGRIGTWIRSPRWAAVLSTAIVILTIVTPIAFVSYQLTREVAAAAGRAGTDADLGAVRSNIDAIPALGAATAWMDRVGIDIETEIGKLAASYLQDMSGLARGSLAAVVQFLIVIFLLYFVFLDRAEFLRELRGLLPMSRGECDRVFDRAAEAIHANLYASVLTSLVDSAGGTLTFWLLGLPSPFLWGFVMFVLCLLPILGATMVWIPAAAFLAMTDRWPQALALTTWGVTTSIVVDNIWYSRLVGQRMRMHDATALIAFLGGLALFGISGMILGPAIFAVTAAILDVWKRRFSVVRPSRPHALSEAPAPPPAAT